MPRNATLDDLPLLERRRLEAGVLIPLIRALQAEFGEEKVNAVVGRTIREIARGQGEAERQRAGLATLTDVARRAGASVFADGSLVVDVIESDEERFAFNVTRCKFMEMYEAMGARDLGYLLSCGRDFAFFEGLAPEVHFERTQTRMQGADFCDFRYRRQT